MIVDKVMAYTYQQDENVRDMVNKEDGIVKLVIASPESDRPVATGKLGQTSSKQDRLSDKCDDRNNADKASINHVRSTSECRYRANKTSSKHGRSTSECRDRACKASSKHDRSSSECRNKADKASSKPVVKVPTHNAKKLTDINVRSTINTNTCDITGMTVVSEDNVVVADWNNDTIKLIDTTRNKIVSEYRPEKYSYDVTTCKDTVAATIPDVSKVVFLKHDKGLVHDREISVDGNCQGIDWHDDKLCVAFDKKKKLEVMTTTGTVLQTFSTAADGQQLFQDPVYVTVSAANQRIYVSDQREDHVVMLDMTGNQTGTYGDGELGAPAQLAVDKDGVMFLCDYNNDTVHLLSPVGQKLKILLTRNDGIVTPYSICYCDKTTRLFVGMIGCDTIAIYNVS